MTTGNAGQSFVESTAGNAHPPAVAGQSFLEVAGNAQTHSSGTAGQALLEAAGTNLHAPAIGTQLFLEMVISTHAALPKPRSAALRLQSDRGWFPSRVHANRRQAVPPAQARPFRRLRRQRSATAWYPSATQFHQRYTVIPMALPPIPHVCPPVLSTYPTPWFPSFPNLLMPESMLDGMIANNGIRLGWMQSHQCGCVLGSQIPGSPNPNCNTCHGRGIYWDAWTNLFTGLITYMHTSSAPDEPGAMTDKVTGMYQLADPTLTIPFKGLGNENQVWTSASQFDAYVEVDAISRMTSVLQVGDNPVLPYQQQINILSVTIYDPVTQTTTLAAPTEYTISGGAVILNSNYPDGTGYVVEYTAAPVYVAYRRAGGLAHVRPFGAGLGLIPRRFRIVTLDQWTRARKNGFLGESTSPQGLP